MADHTINGWALLSGYSDPRLATKVVPGTKRRLTARKEVLPLLLHYAMRYDRLVRKIDKKGDVFDDWSYSAPRSGNAAPGQWSDHSSGTAIDLNASKEGAQGPSRFNWWTKRSKRLRSLGQKRYKIVNRLIKNHEVLMWGGPDSLGGEYHQPKNWDFMHVAIKPGVSVSDVERVIRKKKIGPDGRKVRKFSRQKSR